MVRVRLSMCCPLLAIMTIVGAVYAYDDVAQSDRLNGDEAKLLAALHRVRRQAAVGELVLDVRMRKAAKAFAKKEMASTAADAPIDLKPLAQRAIAAGHPAVLGSLGLRTSEPANQVVDRWLHRPQSRRDLLSPIADQVGIAAERVADGTVVYAVIFGSSKPLRKSMSEDKLPAKTDSKKLKATSNPTVDGYEFAKQERQVVELVNEFRKAEGLPALEAQPKLAACARNYTIVQAKLGESGHDVDGTTMVTRLEAVGYRFRTAGENVAAFQQDAAEAIASWKSSPPHRANMLSTDYTHIGVGCAKSADGRLYWTQLFAKPQ